MIGLPPKQKIRSKCLGAERRLSLATNSVLHFDLIVYSEGHSDIVLVVYDFGKMITGRLFGALSCTPASKDRSGNP